MVSGDRIRAWEDIVPGKSDNAGDWVACADVARRGLSSLSFAWIFSAS